MKNLFLISRLFAVACLLSNCLHLHAQEQEAAEKTSKARLYYENKEYAYAAQLYEELLKNDYRNTDLLTQCGLSYYHQKKYEQAREKLRLATLYGDVHDKPKMALYYSNLSAAYSHLDDDEKAFENAVKAYYMDKSSQNRLWNAASMAQNLGRYDDCLKLMNEAQIGALNNAFQTLYARCYFGKQDFESAVRYYRVFFEGYDQHDDFAPLIIKDERNNFVYASLHILAATVDLHKQDLIIDNIVRVQQAHPLVMYRQDMLNSFTSPDNFCSTYKLTCAACEKVFRAWVKDPNVYDQLRFNFYALHNYENAASLSTSFLNNDLGELEEEIKQIQFLSVLQLYLQANKKRGNEEDPRQLDKLLTLFDGLFAANKIYTDEEFNSIPGIKEFVINVLDAFKDNYKGVEEQKSVVPLLKKIFERIPNEHMKRTIVEMLAPDNSYNINE